MINIVRHCLLVSVFVVFAGCTSSIVSVPEQPRLNPPSEVVFAVPVNVFSSYISKEAEQLCLKASLTGSGCKNDGIAANEFLKQLEQLGLFTELSPSVSRHDYELLIANQLADVNAVPTQPGETHPLQSFTEFSIEWRGVQLDSFLVHYWHEGPVSIQDTEQIILRWVEHAKVQQIFSTPYLYQAMGASDYSTHLTLPETLGDFQLARRYLYPDPFKGILARYLHPTFSEAIVDIAIYPVLATLDGDPKLLISHELEDAVEQAKQIALTRGMTMEIKQHQYPFTSASGEISGVMSEIVAESDSGESLFASLYVFKVEDKFIKFSTTFPSRIGDPLVTQALATLTVPPESDLMKELRKAL